MQWLRVVLLGLAAAGAVWAAQPPAPVVLAQADAADEPAGEPGPAAGEEESMTAEELEAELERIEQAAEANDELEEYKPSKPLAADLAIALPSDI